MHISNCKDCVDQLYGGISICESHKKRLAFHFRGTEPIVIDKSKSMSLDRRYRMYLEDTEIGCIGRFIGNAVIGDGPTPFNELYGIRLNELLDKEMKRLLDEEYI